MSSFNIIMGSPCTGKTTIFNRKFQEYMEKYEHETVTRTWTTNKGKLREDQKIAYYFPEVNSLFIGKLHSEGHLQGLDQITNNWTMNGFDEFLKENTDKDVYTEANYDFSTARKFPSHIKGLGFSECKWLMIYHEERSVQEERKLHRALKRRGGKEPSQKSFDNAWIANLSWKRIYERFLTEGKGTLSDIRLHVSTDEIKF